MRYLLAFFLLLTSSVAWSASGCQSGQTQTDAGFYQSGATPASTITMFDSSWSYIGPVDVQADGSFRAQYQCIFVQLTCPDGSNAPGNDQANCAPVMCPDGSVAPSGDLASCPSTVTCADGTVVDAASSCPPTACPPNTVADSFGYCQPTGQNTPDPGVFGTGSTGDIDLNIIQTNRNLVDIWSLLGIANSFLSSISSKLTNLADPIVRAINQSKSDIVQALNNSNGILSSIKTALNSISLDLISIASLTANYWNDKFDRLYTKLDDIDFFTASIKTLIEAADSHISTLLGGIPGAITDSYVAVAGVIYDSNMAVQGAVNNVEGAVHDLGFKICGKDDNCFQSVVDAINFQTDKAAAFFAGTPSALSDHGSAVLAAGAGENPLATPEEHDVSSLLNTDVGPSGSCPAPIDVPVMGQVISFSYQPLCDWAGFAGNFLMVVAAIASIRIIAGGF